MVGLAIVALGEGSGAYLCRRYTGPRVDRDGITAVDKEPARTTMLPVTPTAVGRLLSLMLLRTSEPARQELEPTDGWKKMSVLAPRQSHISESAQGVLRKTADWAGGADRGGSDVRCPLIIPRLL